MRSLEILVPLDGSPWSEAATILALELAARAPQISRVTGLHVVSVVRVSGRLLQDLAGLLGFQPVIVPEKVEAHYRARGQAFLDSFKAACVARGVRHRQILDQGNVVDRIVHHGDQSDLVVLGARGLTEQNYPGHGGKTVERIVKSVSTSVMVAPRELGPLSGLLLGFDGSDGSSKALRSARHLVEIWPMPLHAVHVSSRESSASTLEEVESYFQGMDVDLSCHPLSGVTGETLLSTAGRLGCNMIVVGYRGRAALGGGYLGRVTEWLLRFEDIALLISR